MCLSLIKFLNKELIKLNSYNIIRQFGNKEMLSVLDYKEMLKKVHNVSHAETLKEARELLKAGEVIAVPTDTVYGLACDANNVKAIQKLYDIKGRDSYKPVAICVKDLAALRRYGHAEHISSELLQRLLPGPITIIIERTQNLSNPSLNPSTSKVGIRIPDFQFIQQLCAMYPEQPLALTSANRSAEPSSLNVQEFAELWPQLGGIFDGGQLGITEHQRAASTVIDLSSSSALQYKIVREGLALKNTLNILHEFGYKPIEL